MSFFDPWVLRFGKAFWMSPSFYTSVKCNSFFNSWSLAKNALSCYNRPFQDSKVGSDAVATSKISGDCSTTPL